MHNVRHSGESRNPEGKVQRGGAHDLTGNPSSVRLCKEPGRGNPEGSGWDGRHAPFAKRKGREQAKRCERGMPGRGWCGPPPPPPSNNYGPLFTPYHPSQTNSKRRPKRFTDQMRNNPTHNPNTIFIKEVTSHYDD